MVLRSSASGGEDTPFRQEHNLFYLTGISEPNTSLILFPEIKTAEVAPGRPAVPREILFVSIPGGGTQAAAAQRTPEKPGFESVRPSAEFQTYFDRALLGTASVVYLDYQRSRSLNGPLTADEQILKQSRDRGATFTLKPAAPLIAPLRRIKSPAEIEILKAAAVITAEAQKEAMRTARPGMYEYQLQSVIEHVFSFNGARRPGFPTIVGSGENSCILHWSENTRQMRAGDVAVLDIGAEYRMYTADITRTIPISGAFTKRQREIYEIVLKANQTAIDMVAPGVSMRDVSEKVDDVLTDGLVKLGLIKDKSQLRQYYYHGLSHSIGLQVHDVGGLGQLEPGMIITIEPGLYLRGEGLGVRIEDDVLITESGHMVLTAGAPKAVEDVERLMKEDGLDFSRYLIKAPGR
jgi:Xaa-Pro aminopeptidase